MKVLLLLNHIDACAAGPVPVTVLKEESAKNSGAAKTRRQGNLPAATQDSNLDTRFGNLCPLGAAWHSYLPMTHFPQHQADRRATRVHVGSTIPALVTLEDGNHAKGKLQTISVTGGLLRLPKALDRGDFVEVAFKTQSGPVQGMAEMLNPTGQARDGILQPFRFIALGDDDHRNLRMVVDAVSDRSFMGIRSGQFTLAKS